jgi:endonuclease/exonuclease/phosphatase family metal-dependent hydrolase
MVSHAVSPGDRVRNQIDFITINKRFRNSIKNVKTYPGADCGEGCDHVPVVAEMKVKVKITKKDLKIRL